MASVVAHFLPLNHVVTATCLYEDLYREPALQLFVQNDCLTRIAFYPLPAHFVSFNVYTLASTDDAFFGGSLLDGSLIIFQLTKFIKGPMTPFFFSNNVDLPPDFHCVFSSFNLLTLVLLRNARLEFLALKDGTLISAEFDAISFDFPNIKHIQFNSNQKLSHVLVFSSGPRLWFFDLKAQSSILSLMLPYVPTCVALSAAKTTLCATSFDNVVHLWSLRDPSTPLLSYKTQAKISSISFHPRIASRLALGDVTGRLYILDCDGNASLLLSRTLDNHESIPIRQIDFHSERGLCLVCSVNGSLLLRFDCTVNSSPPAVTVVSALVSNKEYSSPCSEGLACSPSAMSPADLPTGTTPSPLQAENPLQSVVLLLQSALESNQLHTSMTLKIQSTLDTIHQVGEAINEENCRHEVYEFMDLVMLKSRRVCTDFLKKSDTLNPGLKTKLGLILSTVKLLCTNKSP
ncbi:hypothetical protein RCL1_003701 [Eukaryota sp. TZLM3-RCL]